MKLLTKINFKFMGGGQLFFWRHKHSKAVIKHEDYEKLPKEHKIKFIESPHDYDSTHHVMNYNGDWNLDNTLGLMSINLGIVQDQDISTSIQQDIVQDQQLVDSSTFDDCSGVPDTTDLSDSSASVNIDN